MYLHNLNREKIEWTPHFSRICSDRRRVVFVPENPPKKAKKSEKLTIAEEIPPKKPPHTLRKSPFYVGLLFSLSERPCGAGQIVLKKGAVAGRTATRVFVKALDVVLCGSIKGFRLLLRRGAPL